MGRNKSYFYEDSGLAMPQEIKLDTIGNDMKTLLQNPCVIDKCKDPFYNELHLHELLNTVAVVVVRDNDNLDVATGRVLGVIKTPDGFFYYLVRIPTNPHLDQISPMWTVFKYLEIAKWRLDNVYTSKEKEDLVDFLKKNTTKRELNKKRGEILPEYANKLMYGTMPTPQFTQEAVLDGVAAVFCNNKIFQSNCTTSSGSSSESHNSPAAVGVPNTIEKVLQVVKREAPIIMFIRLFENASENLAVMLLSRLPDEKKISYKEAYEKMKQGNIKY